MAENYQYIDTTGVIVPDTSDILTDVQDEFKSVFGADLSVEADTPQGVLITSQAIARDEVVRNNAALANQINPNLAGGIFLDALAALTGLRRDAGTQTLVEGVSLTGVPSTIIPIGSQAQTANGDVFETLTSVIIASGGTATADFRSVEMGAIACGVGDLDQIITPILGWETVNNTVAGILGQSEQTDEAFRTLRRRTLALQGVGIPEAIISALYDVDGVTSLTFRENVEATTEVIDGVSLEPHSIYACVQGGSDDDVARALLNNKSAGCNWNGTTEVDVLDEISGQTYPVKFDRPDEIPVLIRLTVKILDTIVDPISTVREAIMNYVNGTLDGEPGFVVGGGVSAFEIAGAVNIQYPGFFVQVVETTKASVVSWSTAEIPIEIFEIATTQSSSITVTLA